MLSGHKTRLFRGEHVRQRPEILYPVLVLKFVQMVALWSIAIDKLNPDGTPKLKADGKEVEEDEETKEHVEYETENDNQVVSSKRTKYRTWKEFEDGSHSQSLITHSPLGNVSDHLLIDDTCIQKGYWSSIWDFIEALVPLPAKYLMT